MQFVPNRLFLHLLQANLLTSVLITARIPEKSRLPATGRIAAKSLADLTS